MTPTLPDIHFSSPSGFRCDISMAKTNAALKQAQFWLDNQIMADMLPYMPMNTGTFIQATRSRSAAMAGTGMVCAAAPPMGRMLYYGKVMVDAETGKGARPIRKKTGELIFRFRKGARLIPTSRNLTWTRPQTQPEWFEVAKKEHYQDWVAGVQAILSR